MFKRNKILITRFYSLLIVFLSIVFIGRVHAQEFVCAEVSIQIVQELTLERQGFEATLEIENVLTEQSLDKISVDVILSDELGNKVLASSNPNATDAQFFIRPLRQEGLDLVNGSDSLAAGQKATLTWLIVPAVGSAKNSQVGTLYWVGATFNYELEGAADAVPVVADSIFVKAMPELTLDYFLPENVFSDNPFTPEVEPKEAFPLCVRVKNNGLSVAKSLKIESAQPKIVENKQGLLIDFEIIGAFLGSESIQPSLLVDFGDIASNSAKSACWLMETTLSGRFKNFTASYSHDDDLGGRLTSLINSVNTHILLKRVLVQLPGHDTIPDLLVKDASLVRVYDTEGAVNNVNIHAIAPIEKPDGQLLFRAPEQTGMALFQMPWSGDHTHPPEVVRYDGKRIAPDNIWIARLPTDEVHSYSLQLNVFDSNAKGRYIINTAQTAANRPPQLPVLPLSIGFAGETLKINFQATDPDNQRLSLSWSEPPTGMQLQQESGTGVMITWTPDFNQIGRHDLVLHASDGELTASQPLFFLIRDPTDRDGDGLPDNWEREHFLNLDQDGFGDFDGDGLTNLEELLADKNPALPDGPQAPSIITPSNGFIEVINPELIIQNSLYSGPYEVIYEFEVYQDAVSGAPLYAYYTVAQGNSGVTSWQAPSDLLEDAHYIWRVRASNQFVKSLWSYGEFTVNSINAAPTSATLNTPEDRSELNQAPSHLSAIQATDPDGDELVYQFEIFSTAEALTPVVQSPWLQPQAATNSIAWQPSIEFDFSRHYFWRVTVKDVMGETASSDVWQFSVVSLEIAPDAPAILSPLTGQRVSSSTPQLRFQAASNTDLSRTHFVLELDSQADFGSAERQQFTVQASDDQIAINDTDAPLILTLPELKEDHDYFWRVKAETTQGMSSDWVDSHFFVNAENTVPSTPIAKNPGQDAWVASLQPQLAVHEVSDSDHDSVYYQFQLFSSSAPDEELWQTTSTSPDSVIGALLEDNQWYIWRVRAIDEQQARSEWSEYQRFYTDDNGENDVPNFTWTHDHNAVMMYHPRPITLRWQDDDPDSDASITLFYRRDGSDQEQHLTTLSENPDGQFDQWRWDTKGIAQGTYRLYARISDEQSTQTIEAPFIVVFNNRYIQQGKVTWVDQHYLRLAESGGDYAASLMLSKRPFTDITVNIVNRSKGITLFDDTVTFTADNWDVPQAIRFRVEDDCRYNWYQPLRLIPKIADRRDPQYLPRQHRALLGHVVNDETQHKFSRFAQICSMTLLETVQHGTTFEHQYQITLKSTHPQDLADLQLSVKSKHPNQIGVKSDTLPVSKLGAKADYIISVPLTIETQNQTPISASQLNWSLVSQ
ncbi:fibronectin type III domain-containing protein [Vibrio nigripulchritudo]|uniref:hypothetical protein n=1 Tax=Vibrio nigripulchritudo TaxID=28173 RepID=UPI0024920A15|nr:hypothetical protein [Vibrio nigripulchritudo]BDU40247.1 hypothetical protein TUMSATVNIG2_47160 [Vibrio nigripulchritudo]BDU45982.1 hypothetical protein TUMSATVNIG3_47800 [Vibrio nigripulchritudo]